MNRIEQAVILAGGLGTRLRPLTYKIPKAMVPILGKPFLQYQLGLLKRNGINDIVLCVGYLGSKIIEYFGDGSELDMHIKYSVEDKLLGTGGALKKAQKDLLECFFILNGDTYHSLNYSVLPDFFYRYNRLYLITVFTNKERLVKNNVKVDSENFVVKYCKRREDKDMNGVEAGVSIMKKDAIRLIPDKKVVSLEEEIYPILIERKQIIAYMTDKKFYDIGSQQGMQAFENDLQCKTI